MGGGGGLRTWSGLIRVRGLDPPAAPPSWPLALTSLSNSQPRDALGPQTSRRLPGSTSARASPPHTPPTRTRCTQSWSILPQPLAVFSCFSFANYANYHHIVGLRHLGLAAACLYFRPVAGSGAPFTPPPHAQRVTVNTWPVNPDVISLSVDLPLYFHLLRKTNHNGYNLLTLGIRDKCFGCFLSVLR